jgi:hypothetical protein
MTADSHRFWEPTSHLALAQPRSAICTTSSMHCLAEAVSRLLYTCLHLWETHQVVRSPTAYPHALPHFSSKKGAKNSPPRKFESFDFLHPTQLQFAYCVPFSVEYPPALISLISRWCHRLTTVRQLADHHTYTCQSRTLSLSLSLFPPDLPWNLPAPSDPLPSVRATLD